MIAPIRPLHWLVMWLFPLCWLISRDKRELAQRCRHTLALRQKVKLQRQALRDTQKQTAEEAQNYAQLIQECYARLRQVHQPRADYDSASGQRRHRAQYVQFELIRTSAEIIYFKLLTRRKTLFGSKNALPYGVRVMDLVSEESLAELSFACERVVSAVYEDPRKGAWIRVHRLNGLAGLPTHVSFSRVMEHYPADTSQGTLLLGISTNRRVESANLARAPHVLIGGATGSGKSNMINCLICQLIRVYSPHDLQLLLIDLKRMEFANYATIPHLAYQKIIMEDSEAIEALKLLLKQVKERALKFQGKVKELSEWNAKYPDQALPRIVLVIDEFAELTIASGPLVRKEVLNLVTRICNLGRAVGIHLIIATQRPAVQVVPNDIKIDMPLVISGQVQNTEQSKVILGVGGAAELPDIPGRMIISLGAKLRTIQTPYISDEDVAQAIQSAKRWGEGTAALVKATAEEAEPEEQPEAEAPRPKVVITNSIEAWVNERCEWGPYLRGFSTDLYEDYVDWCREQQRPPETQNALGLYLKSQGCLVKVGKVDGVSKRFWLGIALATASTISTNSTASTQFLPLGDDSEDELDTAAR